MSALTGTRFTVVARLSDETVLHVGARVGAEALVANLAPCSVLYQ
jgi:hypothetical protein